MSGYSDYLSTQYVDYTRKVHGISMRLYPVAYHNH